MEYFRVYEKKITRNWKGVFYVFDNFRNFNFLLRFDNKFFLFLERTTGSLNYVIVEKLFSIGPTRYKEEVKK